MVAQARPTAEHYVRQPDDKWLLSTYRGLEAVVDLGSIGCSLPTAEVYDKAEWPEAGSAGLRVVKEREDPYRYN